MSIYMYVWRATSLHSFLYSRSINYIYIYIRNQTCIIIYIYIYICVCVYTKCFVLLIHYQKVGR